MATPAFVLAFQIAKSRSKKFRLVALATFGILAIPGASFAIYYAHLLPEPAWYFQFRSLPGTEYLFIAVGACGGALASLLPQSLFLMPLTLAAAFCIAPIIKPFIGPIPENAITDRWEGDVCLQSTPSTCGAASVATILRTFEISVSESELAREAFSYAGGTEAWYLARTVRRRGLNAHFHFSPELPQGFVFPAVVGVTWECRAFHPDSRTAGRRAIPHRRPAPRRRVALRGGTSRSL